MRDYDVFVYATADPRTGIAPQHLRYRFRHCVRALATSAVPPEVWKRSLDERLVDYEQGVDLDGYVWGVKWQMLYPGMKLLSDSPEAERWSQILDMRFPRGHRRDERPQPLFGLLGPLRRHGGRRVRTIRCA
jgi:hypothetical protein